MTLYFNNKKDRHGGFSAPVFNKTKEICAMAEYTEILRQLREDHDLTQAQAAAALGTTQ